METMHWEPNGSDLERIMQLLREAQSSDNEVQRRVHNNLQDLNQVPDFSNYLVFVFMKRTAEDEGLRSVAGIILKNNVEKYFHDMSPVFHEIIKQESFVALGDSSKLIRGTVGTLVSVIAGRGGLENWPDFFPGVCKLLESGNDEALEGTFGALVKVFEDCADQLDNYPDSLRSMIPKCLQYFRHPLAKIRSCAILCINQMVFHENETVMEFIDEYVQGLFALATDASVEVRSSVCRSLVMVLDMRVDKLMPHMGDLVEYMLVQFQDEEESVALEACEFWVTLAEQPVCKEVLAPYLPRLMILILCRMRYCEVDIFLLAGCDEDDQLVPDQEQDIKPMFHKSKVQGGAGQDGVENDDDEDIEDLSCWNVRKCAAAAMDLLATVFGVQLLPLILCKVNELLSHQDWIMRESGILALGSMADGCMVGMVPHMPGLILFLIQSLKDDKSLIRSITCWTLTRYSSWIIEETRTQGHQVYFKPMILELLVRVLDSNKRVQEAACSAVSLFIQRAASELDSYMEPILSTAVLAFSKYQTKNLLNLYDMVSTLAQSVGDKLNKPEIIETLMPPIIQKWNSLGDDNRELFPLLECMADVVTSLKLGFLPYSEPVFMRCIKLLQQTLTLNAYYLQDPEEHEEPEKDFAVVSLDLLSSLADGLGCYVTRLVAATNLTSYIRPCVLDDNDGVRQSAFALLGDLTKSSFEHVKPILEDVLPILGQNLNPEKLAVCNNAAWALGEIALNVMGDMRPYIHLTLNHLAMILTRRGATRTLLENVSVTIGRLGFYCPREVSPLLGQIVLPWCSVLRTLRDNDEKDSAFRGLCRMTCSNPGGIAAHFIYFCDAVLSWRSPVPDLKETFALIMGGYKNEVGEERWQIFCRQLPPAMRERLRVQYNL